MSFDEIQGVKLNVHDVTLLLPVILFLEIRIGKVSRTTLRQRTSNISMDMLRDSEAGNSVLTFHDFSVYNISKEKKSFNIMLKVLYFNLCISP